MTQRLVVLGGGISGIASSYFAKRALAEKGIEGGLTLIEGKDKLGGWFWSERDPETKLILERGPHSFRPAGPSGLHVVKLVEELGLEDQAVGTSPESSSRYLWVNGKMHQLPRSLFSLFTGQMTWKLPWLGLREAFLIPKRTESNQDESVYDFFARRFSPFVAEYFADALVQGIYAGDIRQLSVDACFPILVEMEKKHGSVVRGMFYNSLFPPELDANFLPHSEKAKTLLKCSGVSFPGGMKQLTEELVRQTFAASAKNDCVNTRLLTRSTVTKIESDCTVELENGDRIATEKVLSTLPLPSLLRVLPQEYSEDLAELLSRTKYASVGVVNLGFDNIRELPLKGFGHLIPTNQNEGVIGMIYDSHVFPQQSPKEGTCCLTVMMGGMKFPEYADLSEAAMIDIALQKTKEHLGIESKPCISMAVVHRNAIPQYPLGHRNEILDIKSKLKDRMPGLEFIGNHVHGVGIADSVANARLSVQRLLS